MSSAAAKRIELEEKTKAELVAIGIGLEPPIDLGPELKKGDMVDQLLKHMGFAATTSEPTESSAGTQDLRAKDLPPLGRLFELPRPTGKLDKDGKPILEPGQQWRGRMYRLRIMQVEGGEAGPVDVTVNGHNYRILRNVDVVVPEPVINVLNDAVIDTFEKSPETGEARPVQYKRFPFTAVPV